MSINNHMYKDALLNHSVKAYGTLVPSYVTLHYTMGGSVSGTVNYLNDSGFGYNVIVDRNGDIYQTAPFNRIVRHAGSSNWRGWDSLNRFSIGISLANYGPCYLKNGKYFNSYNSEIAANKIIAGSHYNGAKKYQNIYWEKYPKAQIQSALKVVKSIINTYQIRDILRHDDVSIARKIDTGPSLDITPFHALIQDRSGEKIYKFRVVVPSGETLTLRKSYNVSSSKEGQLNNGEEVYIHSFAYRRYNGKNVKTKWCAISKNGFDRIGFVNSDYLEAVGNFV